MGIDDVMSKYTKEQLKAAYALNLCTVSISQIIEYNDVNIMEQEYETILNNLNLEHMPKDEALLKILKQLLDTISFFRIQEKEKDILEKEYQHRVKNAIWSALPNMSVVIAGKSWISMAISLATQIGTGYMNYRRVKADLNIEMDKKRWELERTALEQFHGLRRELFDTAWRLADVYKFPDELRLTERQIKKYNEILMDYDEIRMYERLDTIKAEFIAYPPFWYQMGSVANRISQDESLSLETRMQYRCEALSAFHNYWKSNEFPLLREDYLASACALEHAELLNIECDVKEIEQLLCKAEKYSGRSNDVLQICAVGYLKIGQKQKAMELFRVLVNEEYNLAVNSQMLSGLYINAAFSDDLKLAREAKARYEILTTRVKSEYLLKMPASLTDKTLNEVEDEFLERQESLLYRKYIAVIQGYMDKFIIRLGKLIPEIKNDDNIPDFYYSAEGIEQRLKDMNSLFNSSFKKFQKENYMQKLAGASFVVNYFDEINRFFSDIIEMNCIRDRNRLKEIITEKIQEKSTIINSLYQKIDERNVSYNDMCSLIELVSYSMFEDFVVEVSKQVSETILGMNKMERFSEADNDLSRFCVYHNLPEPNALLEVAGVAKSDDGVELTYFGYELLGESGENYQKEHSKNKIVESIVKRHLSKIEIMNDNEMVCLSNSAEFIVFFEKFDIKKYKNVMTKAVAIYADKSNENISLIFTTDGIVPVDKKKIKECIPYMELSSDDIKNKIKSMKKTIAKDAVWGAVALNPVAIYNIVQDSKSNSIMSKVELLINQKFRPMIDEIAVELIERN